MDIKRSEEVYDSANRPHPVIEELRAVIKYWDLVVLFTSRSIKTRYKRSVLGVVWTMLNPLLTMIVLSLVFSQLFRFRIPHYPVYILSGLTVWAFFSSTTLQAMGEIVYSGGLIKRIYVPKAIFALSAIGTNLVNLAVSIVILLLIALVTGVELSLSLLILPLSILLLSLFALGISLILETAAVFFADIMPIYDVILMIWMYATPIIYPLEIIPDQWLGLFLLNPLYYFLKLVRDPIFFGIVPGWNVWAISVGYSLISLFIGWYIFTKKSNEYAYRI